MKLIGTCKQCKWWALKNWKQPRDNFDRYCANKSKLGEETDFSSDSLAYSYNEGGWLEPGPDFGCIHWEASDETP